MFEFSFLISVYAWTVSKDLLFYIWGERALPAVQFTVPVFLGFTFYKRLMLQD